MKSYSARLALDAVFMFIVGGFSNMHTLGLVSLNLWLTPMVGILATVLSGISLIWLIEEPNKWKKFGFVLSSALGWAVGDLLVIWVAGM